MPGRYSRADQDSLDEVPPETGAHPSGAGMDDTAPHPATAGLDLGAHGDRHPPTHPGHARHQAAANPGDRPLRPAASGDTQKRHRRVVLPGAEVVPAHMAPSPPYESLRAGPGTKTGGRCR